MGQKNFLKLPEIYLFFGLKLKSISLIFWRENSNIRIFADFVTQSYFIFGAKIQIAFIYTLHNF